MPGHYTNDSSLQEGVVRCSPNKSSLQQHAREPAAGLRDAGISPRGVTQSLCLAHLHLACEDWRFSRNSMRNPRNHITIDLIQRWVTGRQVTQMLTPVENPFSVVSKLASANKYYHICIFFVFGIYTIYFCVVANATRAVFRIN